MAYEIRSDHCSGCQQCINCCPVKAVKLKNGMYWIDPGRCIDCGVCAPKCHNNLIWKIGEEPPKAAPHAPVHLDCDLVVVGAGASGLISAALAAQAGKRVIVLEKGHEVGGNSMYATFFACYYSKLHKEAGLPDTRLERLHTFMKDIQWKQDIHLVWNVFQAMEELMDWLIDDCGCAGDFQLGVNAFRTESVVFKRRPGVKYEGPDRSTAGNPAGSGPYIVSRMNTMCRKHGVDIRLKHEAIQIHRNDQGAVCGVTAKDSGGLVEISCKACILAAGCFSHNQELMYKANPLLKKKGVPIHLFSVPTCTGDGIRLAEEVGADIDYVNLRAHSLGPMHHPYGYATTNIANRRELISINRNGRRWICEYGSCGPAKVLFNQQPDCVVYTIGDAALIQRAYEKTLEIYKNKGDELRYEYMQAFYDELERECEDGIASVKADTLEELAEKIGAPPDALVDEVKRYNEFCRKGFDEDFYKAPKYLIPISDKGPYYAIMGKRFQENAMGGSKTDSFTRCLGKEGSVIHGLYAVGDCARGVQIAGSIEAHITERQITAFTWAVTSGYIAGKTVLKDLKY